MKQRKNKRNGSVQGHALLYGRSSKAIRIVNGEKVELVANKFHSPKKKTVPVKQVQKNYVMSEDAKKRLDNLQDPLAILSKYERAKKFETVKSTEKYEYGLSDW